MAFEGKGMEVWFMHDGSKERTEKDLKSQEAGKPI